jgi:HD-GYP domain-containing protein (c-di-GMP phosphodiesterase class II)
MKEKFRISDIFKKFKEDKKPPAQGIRFYQPKPDEREAPEKPTEDKINFSTFADKDLTRLEDVEVSILYSEAVSRLRQIYKKEIDTSTITGAASTLVQRIVDVLSGDGEDLLMAALIDYPRLEEYFYYHIVNVCIISICLGQGLGYERARLVELGIAALLHDTGLTRYLDITNQSKRLNPQEYGEIKKHPLIGPEMLDKISDSLDASIFEVMRQEHERIDGSGYPKGLRDDQIIEYAQIVGLSDVYEAMIHRRPYRDKHPPLEAIKTILSNKYSFDHKLVKLLIERIGVFPMGSFVQLNTREVGRVLKENPGSPLRPVVNILFDAAAKRLKQPRQINLAANPTVYILGTVPVPVERHSNQSS